MITATEAGKVEGRAKDGVLRFSGIPFAAPPTGSRRFAPPGEHPGWSGVRDATAFGPMAPQAAGTLERLAGAGEKPWDEDCLTLNVQTPACDDARRPVMVWIHGGGFVTGAGSIPWYDGARLATNGDVVVVSLNYRLGAFGWLHLAEVDPALAGSGNTGLLDQVAALRWVRANIASFGGDPGNVTIFGESAGAMSVATLMGTPAAAGLFHKAIAQSGAAHSVQTVDDAAEVAARLMARLGVSDVEGLRAVPAAALLDAQHQIEGAITRERATRPTWSGLGLPFQPVVDGSVLPRHPLDAIREGSSAAVPLVTGTTRDEWNLFTVMLRDPMDEQQLVRRLGRMVEDPHAVAALYRQARDDASHDELWSAVMTDRAFRIPAIRLAEAQSRHQPAATFVYLFTWATDTLDGRLGSCHALEIPFVFDNLDRPGVAFFAGVDPPQDLADAMHRAWLAFARTGDPNHGGLTAWPAYDIEQRATMHFDTTCSVHHDPGAEERAAWDGHL